MISAAAQFLILWIIIVLIQETITCLRPNIKIHKKTKNITKPEKTKNKKGVEKEQINTG